VPHHAVSAHHTHKKPLLLYAFKVGETWDIESHYYPPPPPRLARLSREAAVGPVYLTRASLLDVTRGQASEAPQRPALEQGHLGHSDA